MANRDEEIAVLRKEVDELREQLVLVTQILNSMMLEKLTKKLQGYRD